MRLQQIGHEIRQARLARGLTQAKLASAAGLSRVTLNRLESGTFPDLGAKKLQVLLDQLGLSLAIQRAAKPRRPDFIRMASTMAGVSFRQPLTEEQLILALLTGKIPAGKKPHFRVLLDEAPSTLI